MTIYLGKGSIDWLDPTVNIIAVLLGAILAWSTSFYFERRRLRSEIESHAYSIFYKLCLLVDDMAKLASIVQSARTRLGELGSNRDIWRMMYDSSGFADTREGFTAAEYAILSHKEGLKVVIDLMQVENAHRISMASYRGILKLKVELHNRGLAKKVDERRVVYEANASEYSQIAPLVINLSDISENLDSQIDDFLIHAKDTSINYSSFVKEILKIEKFPIPEFDRNLDMRRTQNEDG